MKIRAFNPEDLEQILEIERQAFPKRPWTASQFLSCYRAFSDGFLVARNGQIVGYIIYFPDDKILSIAVGKEYRRRGIGRALIEEIERRFRPPRLKIECRVSNRAAISFYKKLGFRIVGRIAGYYEDGEDAFEMVKGRLGF
jgi:ribosomal-protein-alanine N-acetyltransferase